MPRAVVILSTVGTALFEEWYGQHTSKGTKMHNYQFGLSDNILELIYVQIITWCGGGGAARAGS